MAAEYSKCLTLNNHDSAKLSILQAAVRGFIVRRQLARLRKEYEELTFRLEMQYSNETVVEWHLHQPCRPRHYIKKYHIRKAVKGSKSTECKKDFDAGVGEQNKIDERLQDEGKGFIIPEREGTVSKNKECVVNEPSIQTDGITSDVNDPASGVSDSVGSVDIVGEIDVLPVRDSADRGSLNEKDSGNQNMKNDKEPPPDRHSIDISPMSADDADTAVSDIYSDTSAASGASLTSHVSKMSVEEDKSIVYTDHQKSDCVPSGYESPTSVVSDVISHGNDNISSTIPKSDTMPGFADDSLQSAVTHSGPTPSYSFEQLDDKDKEGSVKDAVQVVINNFKTDQEKQTKLGIHNETSIWGSELSFNVQSVSEIKRQNGC
ncbi:uncharacterized protein [Antedon mediterranea]|uniref:uncharacterized protein isoform X2 n=1 Tax=Antedon mediterranea TaxID=105859 RepID=UPI003AF74A46